MLLCEQGGEEEEEEFHFIKEVRLVYIEGQCAIDHHR